MTKFVVKKLKMIKGRELDTSIFHINVQKIKFK